MSDTKSMGSDEPKRVISVGQQHVSHDAARPAQAYELRHQKANPACEIFLRGGGVVGCKQPKFSVKGSPGLTGRGNAKDERRKATNDRVVRDAEAELGMRMWIERWGKGCCWKVIVEWR